jgi:hypothetical protein
MTEIVDLNAERNRRAQPDPEFVKQDDYGRPLYTYLLSYDMDGSSWSTQIVAYDEADAEARVAAMRETLRMDGQLFAAIPA